MTLIELVTSLRDILEDKGGFGVDWTLSANAHLLKWTNEELVDFINEAEREVAKRTHCLFDSTNRTICRIATTADRGAYTLSRKILRIRRAKLDSQNKTLVDASWRDMQAVSSTWDTKTGAPYYYVLDWDKDKIVLSPIPTVDDVMWISVYRYPLEDMSWDNRESVEPEVPEEYHRKMLHFAAHLAYSKDEPNTLDAKQATYHLQKFDAEIGPSEDAYSVERKKRVKRSIAYGGIR